MTPCPPADQLLGFAAGDLSGEASASIEAHIDGCADCRRALSSAVRGGPRAAGFGRYRIAGVLGSGGMGIVLLAAGGGAALWAQTRSVAAPAVRSGPELNALAGVPPSPARPGDGAPPARPAPPPPAPAARVELLHAVPATVAVSSTVDNPRILPAHLVDGDPATAWNSRTGDLVGAGSRFACRARSTSIGSGCPRASRAATPRGTCSR